MKVTIEKTHGIVNRVQNGLFAYQGWPSVTSDENGILYAAASSFRVEHICPFGKTAMYISKNGGETWTPPIVINDTYLDDRDAGILYMGKGRMLVTWFTHPAEVYTSNYYQSIKNAATRLEGGPVMGMLASYPFIPKELAKGGSFIRVSEDYGVTWSDTIQVPVSAPHGPSICKDGTLIYLGKEHYAPEGTEEAHVVAAYASEDGGYTWTKRGICRKPDDLDWDNFHEPHVIELDDGTLYGTIRAQGEGILHGFTIYDTKSTDGGRTWSPWRCLNISGSPPHILKHSSGALVIVYGRREPPFGERAIISLDNGETWGEEITLDDRAKDGDLGYPCSTELPDGSIVTVYYQKYKPEDGCAATEKMEKLPVYGHVSEMSAKSEPVFDDKDSILYTKWRIEL
ncbi:MAG: exo-alpha-sialidase [Clostridia bacterium]|nr:exo-alpha-sialidase [Clostridia bacterium]